jgi:PKD repeat protein
MKIRSSIATTLVILTVMIIFVSPQSGYSFSAHRTEDSLIRNGGFETGIADSWEGLSASNIVSAPVYSGQSAVRITGEEASQGNIEVTPGQKYLLTAWFRWETFSGEGWGYDRIRITDPNWSEVAAITKLHRMYDPGQWHKIALAFIPESSKIRVTFGMHGPQDKAELYFDDFRLVAQGENKAPKAQVSASNVSGNAPLTVQFGANSQDPDGAVEDHYWEFGDGTVSDEENPIHVYSAPGLYSAKLTVWDNEGFHTISYKTIRVERTNEPEIEVDRLLLTASEQPAQKVLALSGLVNSYPGSYIVRLVWDHVSLGSAGIVDITPGEHVSWQTPQIPLKPGKNEILITAIDNRGKVATHRIIHHRPSLRPHISNVKTSGHQVGQYEKFEATFDLQTVADNYFFRYDADPPPGVQAESGVSVTGIFKTPSGKVLEQPAFYHQEAAAIPCGDRQCYQQTNQNEWMLRFAPQELGEYQVEIFAQDASGTVRIPVEGFKAIPSNSKGFVQVSEQDPRYFEYSNGELFWPMGPANGSDYQSYKGTGLNLERPWMAGMGAYSTNFARWISSAKEMGNEGFDSNLIFTQRYPGHELSQLLSYPDGSRIWIGWSTGEKFRPIFKAGQEYQVLLRLKTENISGPVDPKFPHGLMLKKHGWPSDTFEISMRDQPTLIPPVSHNADWHTIVAHFTASEQDANNNGSPYLSLYLDNITSGQVYIDYFSIREVLPDTSLGRELMINCSADLHNYVEPGPAAYFDWQVEQGEQNGIHFKYVVHDKRDWIQNHLNQYGLFVNSGDGYYQNSDTRARWLLEQWWRYLIARWGYSTAIHSWELNNEGPPNDRAHFQTAQEFAEFVHRYDSHPHLATTSFWSDWVPELWSDRENYPALDYANTHEYVQDPESAYDIAGWLIDSSAKVFDAQVVMPVMKGETGIGGPGSSFYKYLSEANPGIWYHNLLWAQLSSGPIYNPNYWWSEHLKAIDPGKITAPFHAFIQDLELNQGGYEDVHARSENSALRFVGQKNLRTDHAHLWIQNKQHTWRNVMGVENPTAVTPQSGQVTFQMKPSSLYTIEYWNTYSGEIARRESINADANGFVVIYIDRLESDLAVKLYPK